MVGGGCKRAAAEHLDERLHLRADDHQRGRFQRLDEAAGVADGDDVLHPQPRGNGRSGTSRRAAICGALGILAEELRRGLVVGDRTRGIDVAAVDVMLVLDLPAQPASIVSAVV